MAETKQNDGSQAADIAPAKTIDTSGAPQQLVPDVDMSHPAVDDNPRAGRSVLQNKIDFNDPTIPGHQAVADALNEQGVETMDQDEVAEAAKKSKNK
ncbi:hypothetical protein HCU64_06560 [Methylobacterium sp. C25]|uniref:hypothetical protein n=1 Tax=Methylobacterium sp. C25 TaxID=2721622 RepID=UPI001F29738B|nr:hypothetical protein [Methylobacterium sp. C25]MCE4223408.1 hypothetical protein [Methylobacterium sp. C25]